MMKLPLAMAEHEHEVRPNGKIRFAQTYRFVFFSSFFSISSCSAFNTFARFILSFIEIHVADVGAFGVVGFGVVVLLLVAPLVRLLPPPLLLLLRRDSSRGFAPK
jgi:hypothetical protein